MTASAKAAIVICPEHADPSRRVLGLRVGERLLLALSFAGIQEVCFVGPGKRPSSDRAELRYIEIGDIDPSASYIVVASDTIFDRGLVSADTLPPGVAMTRTQGDSLSWMADVPSQLETMGPGHAESGKGFAIRVDSRQSAKKAQRALLLSLRKPIDGFVSTHLNRYLSLFCTRFLVKTGLPPNFFTIIFMAIGLASAYFATQAEYTWALVLAGVLFQAQSVLDGCDGEMARLTYQFSRRGQWLDSIGDDLTNYSFCFGLAIGQARVLNEPLLYWFGAAVLLLHVITSTVLYRRMLLMGTGDLLAIPDLVRTKEPEGVLGSISDAMNLIMKRDSFIFILSVIVVAQQPLAAFVVYGIGTVPMCFGVVLNDMRISRQNALSEEPLSA
jgi:phosphatidylglycerophosphate synthase